jgi:hypothetical protein
MAKMTAQALAQKWASKVASSTESYKAGVQAVQVNPAQRAIESKERWIQGVNDAAMDGRYEAGLSKVTLSDWKAAAVEKGAPALAAGARLGAAKVERHEREFGPVRDAIVASLPARGTADQNDQRMLEFVRQMRSTRKRR